MPSTAELESAELALAGLRAALQRARQPTSEPIDTAPPAEPPANQAAEPGPAWSLEEAQKLPKKKTAIFLAYNGDGFSVRVQIAGATSHVLFGLHAVTAQASLNKSANISATRQHQRICRSRLSFAIGGVISPHTC